MAMCLNSWFSKGSRELEEKAGDSHCIGELMKVPDCSYSEI